LVLFVSLFVPFSFFVFHFRFLVFCLFVRNQTLIIRWRVDIF
jgi:hypothetical protein